ncbi:hypothetical protein JOB18_042992 [Solea senegalensis]|uniref:Uncharacterized protein n=1 Tax=Solea senegalensis TaxID=28829 RepID=A0AAV6S5D3_SOLSE|nr:hypothetical protein JOB18_042992 [Solea senegalensis]
MHRITQNTAHISVCTDTLSFLGLMLFNWDAQLGRTKHLRELWGARTAFTDILLLLLSLSPVWLHMAFSLIATEDAG